LEINPQAVQAVIDGDAITPQTIQFEVSIKNGGSLLPVTFNVFTYLSDGTKQYV
jgi:archaellum component FlaG (FlaF/FlaG flagellin family)